MTCLPRQLRCFYFMDDQSSKPSRLEMRRIKLAALVLMDSLFWQCGDDAGTVAPEDVAQVRARTLDFRYLDPRVITLEEMSGWAAAH